MTRTNPAAEVLLPAARPRKRKSFTIDEVDKLLTVAIPQDPGDEVILRRNHRRLRQPDGTAIEVRNGMTGRVTAVSGGSVAVELNEAHRASGGCDVIILPVGYVGARVHNGYARTVDTA